VVGLNCVFSTLLEKVVNGNKNIGNEEKRLDESAQVEVGLVKDEICNGILLLLAPHCTDVCLATSLKIRSCGRHYRRRPSVAVLLAGRTRTPRA
jgi:hypothetical protein